MSTSRRFAGTTAVLLVGLFSRCESALAQDVPRTREKFLVGFWQLTDKK